LQFFNNYLNILTSSFVSLDEKNISYPIYNNINEIFNKEINKTIFLNRLSSSFLKKVDLSLVCLDEKISSLTIYIYIFDGLKLKFSSISFSFQDHFEFNCSFFFFD